MFKIISVLVLSVFLASKCFSQVDCIPAQNSKNRQAANRYSPYLGPLWITHLSTLVLGSTMPLSKEEVKENSGAYGVVGIVALGSLFAVEAISCGAVGEKAPEEYLTKEHIDAEFYNQQKKIFWWVYGLDIASLSYMASISQREDRWGRVAIVALLPWVYELAVNRLFFSEKYHLHENPIFLDIKNDPETKKETVSLGFRYSY